MHKNLPIISLPKEEWEGTIIPIQYTTEEYFDVEIIKSSQGYHMDMHKKKFDAPVSHYPEEYDFPDKLYQPHWERACAWGIVDTEGGERRLLACIETCPEEWSNRLMVTELWVHQSLRRQGIGRRLMAIAKEQAILEHRRAVILETQSCNTAAIQFYEREGFELIGFDSCCYSNRDIERREVRIDMGCFLRKKGQQVREGLIIRREEVSERHQVEQTVLNAFWNRYRPGCTEHLLVHKLRESEAYLPELSRIAAAGDEIVGVICYARALLEKDNRTKEVLIMGPLCTAPKWQGCGVGSRLLQETLAAAGGGGSEGVILFGDPEYYRRHGFKSCEHFGITTQEGENFDAFMGLELKKGGLAGFGGRLLVPSVYDDDGEEAVQAYTKNFQTTETRKFPCQF